ncbi:hypothetical protein [Carp edema virus]|nr:hypothetical protein [Carp edema virus]
MIAIGLILFFIVAFVATLFYTYIISYQSSETRQYNALELKLFNFVNQRWFNIVKEQIKIIASGPEKMEPNAIFDSNGSLRVFYTNIESNSSSIKELFIPQEKILRHNFNGVTSEVNSKIVNETKLNNTVVFKNGKEVGILTNEFLFSNPWQDRTQLGDLVSHNSFSTTINNSLEWKSRVRLFPKQYLIGKKTVLINLEGGRAIRFDNKIVSGAIALLENKVKSFILLFSDSANSWQFKNPLSGIDSLAQIYVANNKVFVTGIFKPVDNSPIKFLTYSTQDLGQNWVVENKFVDTSSLFQHDIIEINWKNTKFLRTTIAKQDEINLYKSSDGVNWSLFHTLKLIKAISSPARIVFNNSLTYSILALIYKNQSHEIIYHDLSFLLLKI